MNEEDLLRHSGAFGMAGFWGLLASARGQLGGSCRLCCWGGPVSEGRAVSVRGTAMESFDVGHACLRM